MMPELPRHLQLRVLLLTVREHRCPLDRLRLLGIAPGHVIVPCINIKPAWRSSMYDWAALGLLLPDGTQYCIDRLLFTRTWEGHKKPTGDRYWQTCYLINPDGTL